MDSKTRYECSIQYQQNVMCVFQASSTLDAIATLSRLISEEYPHAQGKVVNPVTGQIVYQCSQRAVC